MHIKNNRLGIDGELKVIRTFSKEEKPTAKMQEKAEKLYARYDVCAFVASGRACYTKVGTCCGYKLLVLPFHNNCLVVVMGKEEK